MPLPIDQMNNDRQADQWQCDEQEWLKKRHGCFCSLSTVASGSRLETIEHRRGESGFVRCVFLIAIKNLFGSLRKS